MWVQIYKSKGDVVLIIEDDGIGISPEQKSTGIGMMNMRSRVEAMHGTIIFEQAEKGGTCVRVKLNL